MSRTSTVCLLLVAGLAVFTACGGGQRPNDEVSARLDPSDAAVERCTQALGAAPADGDARGVAVACADLFERPACQEAHRRAAALPVDASSVGTIFEACKREYCPLLGPALRPAACDTKRDGLDAGQLSAAWSELRAAIWSLELDPSQREQLLQAL